MPTTTLISLINKYKFNRIKAPQMYLTSTYEAALIQANMADELDKAGKCLLADVYDIRGGHVEFLTG